MFPETVPPGKKALVGPTSTECPPLDGEVVPSATRKKKRKRKSQVPQTNLPHVKERTCARTPVRTKPKLTLEDYNLRNVWAQQDLEVDLDGWSTRQRSAGYTPPRDIKELAHKLRSLAFQVGREPWVSQTNEMVDNMLRFFWGPKVSLWLPPSQVSPSLLAGGVSCTE